MMKTQEKSLGELLRQAGKITSRQIQVALGEQKKTREPIGKVLIRLGFVEERDILQVMQGMVVLTFRLDVELFGIETFRVREVLKWAPFEPARGEGPWEGHFNHRKWRLPVLSLRRHLGYERPPLEAGTWFIILEKNGNPFVLWVDQVREVAKFKVDQIEPLPPYLLGKKNDLYYCLGKIKEDLYSILNPDKLVNDDNLPPPSSEAQHAVPS
jgi:chemotaxis signal transduction protein